MKTGIKTLVSAIAVSSMMSFAALATPLEIQFVTDSGFLADGQTVNGFTPSTRNNLAGTTTTCDAGVTDVDNNCGLTFSDASGLNDAYRTLDWGIPRSNGQSGLDIVSYNGTLVADGAWVHTGEITHRNRTIAAGSWSLKSINLLSVFNIVNPFNAMAGAVIDVNFTETPNRTNLANCPYQQTLIGCDDYFTIAGLPLPINFFFDDTWYQIQFRLIPGAGFFLPSENLLVTGENTDNTLFIQARLVDIPEPLTIAILGLGLIGVGFSTRKSANTKAA